MEGQRREMQKMVDQQSSTIETLQMQLLQIQAERQKERSEMQMQLQSMATQHQQEVQNTEAALQGQVASMQDQLVAAQVQQAETVQQATTQVQQLEQTAKGYQDALEQMRIETQRTIEDWKVQAEVAHQTILSSVTDRVDNMKEELDKERDRASELQRQVDELRMQPPDAPPASRVRVESRTQHFSVGTEDEAEGDEQDWDQGAYERYRNHEQNQTNNYDGYDEDDWGDD